MPLGPGSELGHRPARAAGWLVEPRLLLRLSGGGPQCHWQRAWRQEGWTTGNNNARATPALPSTQRGLGPCLGAELPRGAPSLHWTPSSCGGLRVICQQGAPEQASPPSPETRGPHPFPGREGGGRMTAVRQGSLSPSGLLHLSSEGEGDSPAVSHCPGLL